MRPMSYSMAVERLSDSAPADDGVDAKAYAMTDEGMGREVLWVEALLFAWGRWVRDGGIDALSGYECPLGRLIKRGGSSGRVLVSRLVDVQGLDELGLSVERALLDLPRKRRELLRKRYAVGLAWEQIAQELRVSRRTVFHWRDEAVCQLLPVLRRFL